MTETAQELRERAAEAVAHATRLREEALAIERAERAARTPKMPTVEFDDAATITFTKVHKGRIYHYSAVGWRLGNLSDHAVRWAVTGSEDRRFNWPGLLAWIGETNWLSIKIVTEATPILDPDDEPPAAETMGSFGRVKSVDTVTPIGRMRSVDFGNMGAGPYSC